MEQKPRSITNHIWHLKAKNITIENKRISYLSWDTRGYVAALWSNCKEEHEMVIDNRDMACGEIRNNTQISFVRWIGKNLQSLLECLLSQWSFPSIHKVDNIGIFVQLLMEISWK